jgi:tetratricopeptide (TPR) repeat protein
MLRKTTIIVAGLLLVILAGCESNAQRKQAVKEQWQKSSLEIKLGLAKQQYENGNYADALKNIQECINVDATSAESHLVYGEILMAQGKRSQAEEELFIAVELEKTLDEGWYWLGVAAQEARQIGQALKYYETALSYNTRNIDYILAVSECYAAQKQYDSAIKVLESAIMVMPREVSLKVAAADTHSRAGNNDRAISLYEEALLLTSDDEGVEESLAYCYMFGEKWVQGAALFEKMAARLDETVIDEKDTVKVAENEQRKKLYIRTAAVCNMSSGQYARAVACYEKLSISDRENEEIWVKMGQAALGAGMMERALWCGEKARALRPGYADAVIVIGCALYRSGNYSEAEKIFGTITSDAAAGGFAWVMRARCYEKLGQTDLAESAYKKALKLDPEGELVDYLAKGRIGRQW